MFNSNFRVFAFESFCEIFEKSTSFDSSALQEQQRLKTTISSLLFNFDFYDLFRNIDLFDSNLKHSDSNLKHFNKTSNFLRNLKYCQHLYRYRKTHLLLFLFNCLNDSIFKWLQKQSHFDFLHIFNTTLTNVFSSQQQRRETRVRKQADRKIAKKNVKDAKSTSKLQNIDIFDSTACDKSEFELYNEIANFLQNLQQCQHQYRKSNLLKLLSKCFCDFASKWLKLQSKFISLKRFNTILTKAFSFAKTLSRRVSSRRSNFQLSTFDVISKSIENSSNFEITCVRMICKFCQQSFNFNKKLYEHIRNYETLKFVKNSHLSINAINLVCEIEKKSFVTHVSSASFARFQKSIFEFAIAFETVTLLKRSNSSIFTFKTIQKSMKIALFQTTEVIEMTCRHCDETFNFKKSFREHKREQHRRKSIESSLLSINTFNSMCEDEKKSIFDDSLVSSELQTFIATSKQKFESAMIFEAVVSLKNSHLSLFTLKIESKSTKKSTTCQHCKQTFKFKNLLCKHKREQHAKKFVINSSLRSHALKSVCKAEEKSTIKDVTTLFASRELRTSDQKIDVQKHSIVNSLLLIDTIKSTCKVAKKSATASIAKFSKFTSEERAESRTRIAYLFARLKASRLNFSLNTFVTILETMKNAWIQEVACVRAMCKFCKQNFNFNKKFFEHIREHETLKRINTIKATCKFVKISTFSKFIISLKSSSFTSFTLKSLCEFEKKSINIYSSSSHESLIFTTSRNLTSNTKTFLQSVSSKCSSFQLRVFNFASRSTKNASIHRIVCVWTICKRCKQNFNFNNKFHEHICQHHVRKSVKSSDFRVFASDFTYKIVKKSAISCSITSQFASFIFFAASRSQIFSTKMNSRSVSLKDSHFTIATHRIASKLTESASITCSLTFSLSFFWISVRKHQEFYIQKSYLIMNDLSRIFVEKFKSFDLSQHQNRSSFSQNLDICQSTSSIKSHFTIENLSEMFDEKVKKNSLFQSQMNLFFSRILLKTIANYNLLQIYSRLEVVN